MNKKIRPAIAGKVTIVTGASSGIGEVTALEFASAGAMVVLAARQIHRLEKLAETIRCGSVSQYPSEEIQHFERRQYHVPNWR